MTQFPRAFLAVVAVVGMTFMLEGYTDQLPDWPFVTSVTGIGLLTFAVGIIAGWFLPHGAKGMLAGGTGLAVMGMIAAGAWAIVVVIMVVVMLPAIGVFFAGWFAGRALVTKAGLDGHPINDKAGIVLFTILLFSPVAWLVWEARHTVRGNFIDRPTANSGLSIEAPAAWVARIGSREDGGPVAAHGRVFATADDVLYAINSDGTGAWMLPNATSQPLWDDGRLYVGLKSGLARVDPEKGVPVWTAAVRTAGVTRYGGENRRRLSVGASGTIYVNPELDTIHAINPDGTIRWSFRHNAGQFAGAPLEASNGRVYVAAHTASGRGSVCAIDTSGRLEWERRLPITYMGPVGVGADGSVYATGGDRLFALGPDGQERWRRRFSRPVSTPLIDPRGRVLARADAWYVMSPEGRALHRAAGGGHPIFTGDVMLVPGNGIVAVDMDGTPIFRLDIGEDPVWGMNEAAVGPDGMLYVQFSDRLVGVPLPRPPYKFKPRYW